MRNNGFKVAVALSYNKECNEAPLVTAKGERLLADRMLALASMHGVPIIKDIETASSLIKLGVGEEIPYALYEAISVILAHVYNLKAEK